MRKRPITPPPEPEPSEIRERIINAAVTVFSKHSVDMASISRIAEEAGIGHTLLLYHFQNKENLYQAVLDRVAGIYTKHFEDLLVYVETNEIGRKEAVGLLEEWLRRTVDIMYRYLEGKTWPGKIVLYEYVFPSTFFEYLYTKRTGRIYLTWAKLVMAVTGNDDVKTAYFQSTLMYGFVVGFRLQREMLKRSLGMERFTQDDMKWIKNTLVGSVFSLLGVKRSGGVRTKKRRGTVRRADMPTIPANQPPVTLTLGERFSETKERILEGAIRVFSVYSVDMASTRMIAEEAGVRLSLITYHFKTKENLYLTVLDRVFEIYRERFKDLFATIEAKKNLDRQEAVDILCILIRRTIDAFCRSLPNWRGRIVLYEYLYPSACYDDFYKKNIRLTYELLTKAVMAATGNDDRKTAYFQLVAIFGQTVAFRFQREPLKRSLGLADFSEDDLESIGNMVIDNTLAMLGVER